jgi:predicted alpha/beta hydrolase family esterase
MPADRPAPVLLLPPLGDAGPEHWQRYWQRAEPGMRRVEQDDWEAPRCVDWCVRLAEAVRGERRRVVLVGHSTACALVAHWAGRASALELALVRGALLVAPSDPEGPRYPPQPTGFAPMPLRRLPFRTIVIASTDDEYVTVDRARAFADAWGSRLVLVGAHGHLNSASALGMWDEGRALLASLR